MQRQFITFSLKILVNWWKSGVPLDISHVPQVGNRWCRRHNEESDWSIIIIRSLFAFGEHCLSRVKCLLERNIFKVLSVEEHVLADTNITTYYYTVEKNILSLLGVVINVSWQVSIIFAWASFLKENSRAQKSVKKCSQKSKPIWIVAIFSLNLVFIGQMCYLKTWKVCNKRNVPSLR